MPYASCSSLSYLSKKSGARSEKGAVIYQLSAFSYRIGAFLLNCWKLITSINSVGAAKMPGLGMSAIGPPRLRHYWTRTFTDIKRVAVTVRHPRPESRVRG